MLRIPQLRVSLDEALLPLDALAARALHTGKENISFTRIYKKSVDARDKRDVHFSYALDVETRQMPKHLPHGVITLETDEEEITVPQCRRESTLRPVVVGMGPAGLFAALYLAQAGLRPLVLERGRNVEDRTGDVELFFSNGIFNSASNVQFGEGGAGTFSDGKLNSGIKDRRCRTVLKTFVRMGAPEEILFSAKPHIGTDRLRAVVKNLREEIIRLGGEVRFETKLDGLRVAGGVLTGITANGELIETDRVIAAIGHSARDTFSMLKAAGVFMKPKPFSLGVRIEHLQEDISRSQYGPVYKHPALGAADYKLSAHLPDGRAAYTFCMCPGGTVVAAASEESGVVVNGMSCFARDGRNANSALLISVSPDDFGSEDPLSGAELQRKWERAAYIQGGCNYHAPAQRVADFLAGKASAGPGSVLPSYRPGVSWTKLDGCLPAYIISDLRQAIPVFDRKLRGFASPDAVLTGIETRSSSPVRLTRSERFNSVSISGFYPCGEGAGYAGGILSAAVDGLRCAEALTEDI